MSLNRQSVEPSRPGIKIQDAQTVHELLCWGAEFWANRTLIVFEDGSTWTWAQCLAEAGRAAGVLAARDIRAGDRVMAVLPNGADWLRTWWGATLLGAVFVPVNPAYRGQLLIDVCDTVDAGVIVVAPEYSERLGPGHLRSSLDPGSLHADAIHSPVLDDPPRPNDIHCLLMTSGTTGPSKASMTTHAQVLDVAAWMIDAARLDERDIFLADMPWFHLSSFAPAVQMMRLGGRICVRTTPNLRQYWQTAKATGATFAIAPGTVAQFLASQPLSPADRDHSLRFMLCAPLPPHPDRFARRFGLQAVTTAYGSTEANLVLTLGLDTPAKPGTCGKVRQGFTVRIVDDHDFEVPVGEVGELIVRADRPWLQSQGYAGDAQASVRLCRNGWIHTGDALRVDSDGYFYFHDRYKDALRRRGENISSFEVEREVLAYPGVAEAACVAHPGEFGGDDEVKVFVVPAVDTRLDLEDLLHFLIGRMTYFMVPRYFELIDELPKTPTQRVQKHLLRQRGNGPQTWDRETAGYRLTRTGLTTTPKPPRGSSDGIETTDQPVPSDFVEGDLHS
ncbi:AMP-binding protein [Mycobacterium vicinigordonae]|uniref:AMP-binding protein n=1 Tax=Mycobacterium vicinigordonae TaxID=1719132 RepID=A0A7D6E1H4_9MYCO|nr:AMP-binding protein [Mycobacterium vicinigordonae]QLL06366.1 AMP-binding protein [Mycobacterium vicinigordonae]